jgi:hypothetical protein
MTYAKTHSHAASANISKTSAADRPRGRDARRRGTCVSSASMHAADSCSRTELHRLALDAYSMLRSRAADCPRGHLATAAASAWHRCMLPLLLSCMIGASGRSNMLGSCAADHPKRRVLVVASASAPTQAAALDLAIGSADPHSPLRSSAADRPNRRDARRRRCIGSASIKAAALALLSLSCLVGWRPMLAADRLSGVMLAAAAASAQLRYKQLLSLSCWAAQAPTHRSALAQPTAINRRDARRRHCIGSALIQAQTLSRALVAQAPTRRSALI